jgi:predicted small integral membrane protein
MTQEIFISMTTLLASLTVWEYTDRAFERYGVLSSNACYKFLAGGFVAIILGAGIADFVTFLFYGVN